MKEGFEQKRRDLDVEISLPDIEAIGHGQKCALIFEISRNQRL
jgi:hypothetical protein